MNYNQPNNTCLFNTLYVQYVEDIGRNEFFYYDLNEKEKEKLIVCF